MLFSVAAKVFRQQESVDHLLVRGQLEQHSFRDAPASSARRGEASPMLWNRILLSEQEVVMPLNNIQQG
jgi:hypothetical protein